MLFVAILLLLLAVVVFIAWNRNPPDAPAPAATAAPDSIGGG